MVKPALDALGGVAGMPVTETFISVGWLPVFDDDHRSRVEMLLLVSLVHRSGERLAVDRHAAAGRTLAAAAAASRVQASSCVEVHLADRAGPRAAWRAPPDRRRPA